GTHQLVGSPWVVIAAGVLGIVGNGVGAWLYQRTNSSTGKAAYAHPLSDALGSLVVVIGGVAALVGLPAGLADQVAAGFVSGLIVLMGIGVTTGRDVDLLELRHPATWLREMRGGIRDLARLAARPLA